MKANRIRTRMRDMRHNFFNSNPALANDPVYCNAFEMMNRFIDGVPDDYLIDALKMLSKMFVEASAGINDMIKDKNGGMTP